MLAAWLTGSALCAPVQVDHVRAAALDSLLQQQQLQQQQIEMHEKKHSKPNSIMPTLSIESLSLSRLCRTSRMGFG